MLCHHLLLEPCLTSFTSPFQSACCSPRYCERQEEGALGTSVSLMLYRWRSAQPLKYTIYLLSELWILSKSLLSYCRLGARVQVVRVLSMQKAGLNSCYKIYITSSQETVLSSTSTLLNKKKAGKSTIAPKASFDPCQGKQCLSTEGTGDISEI